MRFDVSVEVSPPNRVFTRHPSTHQCLTDARGLLRLISQYLNDHRPLAELAAVAAISLSCDYKWLARFRSGGPAAHGSLLHRGQISEPSGFGPTTKP